MIYDSRTLDEGMRLEADLCVIGGGAAAIAMTQRLAGAAMKVCILESGGKGLEKETQALSNGEASGIPYFDLIDTRYRMLGGSTHRWGARGAPMVDIDFRKRPWVPMSGWPISGEDLAEYYPAVQKLVGHHNPFHYHGAVWDEFDAAPPKINEDILHYSAFQFGKNVLLGEHNEAAIKDAPNIHLYLHANVTALECAEKPNHLDHVKVKTLSGKAFSVKAKTYVLASGGIENPRLLLLSDSLNSDGLCNERDHVGRYFMEHPTLSAGTIKAKDKQSLVDIFSPGLVDGRLVEVGLALSEKVQEETQSLNAIASAKVVVTQDSTQALRELMWNLRHRRMPQQLNWYYKNKWLMERLTAIAKDPFGIVANIYRHQMGKPKRFNVDSVYLEIRTEQAPNPDSRVTLSHSKDALGLRRGHLHWAMIQQDKTTMQVTARLFDAELKRLELGELEMESWLMSNDLTWSPEMVGGHHHMGTTRMADSAAKGVVDGNCRTHAVDNLYIAGSSVFPTSSYVNPTFTILALAMRLADHLKSQVT